MSPPAKQRGGIIAPLSAARTAQRAFPTRFRVQSAKISWNSFHEPESGSPALQRVAQFRFMDREQVRKEHGAFHEPGGARLRRALTDSCGWEIRARRSLAPPFMAILESWRLPMNRSSRREEALAQFRVPHPELRIEK